MNTRKETVDEYLQRGGTVTKIPQVLDTVGSWWGYNLHQFESLNDDTQQVVSWKSVQPDDGLILKTMTEGIGNDSIRDVTNS